MTSSATTALAIKAAVFGSVSDMLYAIGHGCDLETRDDAGETLAALCSFYGKAEPLRALLEAGADPNARSARQRMTPAHRAARFGHIACLEVLAEYGADFDALDSDLNKPADCAARMGRHGAAEFIEGRARSIAEQAALERTIAPVDTLRQAFRL